MRGITTKQKEALCEAYNSDRVKFSELAYQFAGDNADPTMIDTLDRLNELYKTNDAIAFGRDDSDMEEVSELQDRLITALGVDIRVDTLGQAFLIQDGDLVSFKTESLDGLGIVRGMTDDTISIEFDPLKVGSDYEGDGLETIDKEEFDYLRNPLKEPLLPEDADKIKSYIELGRIDYTFERGHNKAKEPKSQGKEV